MVAISNDKWSVLTTGQTILVYYATLSVIRDAIIREIREMLCRRARHECHLTIAAVASPVFNFIRFEKVLRSVSAEDREEEKDSTQPLYQWSRLSVGGCRSVPWDGH